MAGGLKEVRERIKSVINTQQITKAMKMVSAAKLRKAQNAIIQLRPFAKRLNGMLSNALSSSDGGTSTLSFSKVREVKNVLIIVMTSNRGLCGAFNTNICKEAVALITEKYGKQRREGNLTILFVGKKGYDYFRRRFPDLKFVTDFLTVYDTPAYENSSALARQLMDEFSSGKYDAAEIVYSRFKNAGTQIPTAEQWLPVPKMETPPSSTGQKKADYIFEPDEQQLLESLMPISLQVQFHKCLLDTHASEHGARMTAMDKATDNAEELLKDLKINYNKARQEAITTELGEIVGGAAALEG